MAKLTIKEVLFENETEIYQDPTFSNVVLIDGDAVDPDKNLDVPPPGVSAAEKDFLFGENPDNIQVEYDVTGTLNGTPIISPKHVLQKARALYALDSANDVRVIAAFGAAKTSFRQGNWALTIRRDNDDLELVVGFINGFIDIAAIQAFISGGGIPKVAEINNGFGANFKQADHDMQPNFNIVTGGIEADGIDDFIKADGISINYVGSWYLVSKVNGGFQTYIEFFNAADKRANSFNGNPNSLRLISGIEDVSLSPGSFETSDFALYRFSFDGDELKIERNGMLVGSMAAAISDISDFIADLWIFHGPSTGSFSKASMVYFARLNGIEDPAKVTERTNDLIALYNL